MNLNQGVATGGKLLLRLSMKKTTPTRRRQLGRVTNTKERVLGWLMDVAPLRDERPRRWTYSILLG